MAGEFSAKKVGLPEIHRIKLANFDLYSLQPNADVRIDKNVFCLIGANGLGKSTFLNTLIYGLTGAIPDPSRKFSSAPEYFKEAMRSNRTEDYFSGRISEEMRSLAAVTVELAWPSTKVTVTRSLFDGPRVTSLSLKNDDSTPENINATDAPDDLTAQSRYEQTVVELSGLEDFSQFVFLFHFANTFDEGRHLLMWDRAALTNALYLAFGADPAAAKAADKIRRDMEREDSRGRNIRFSARHVKTRIDQLAELLGGNKSDDIGEAELRQQHQTLVDRQTATEQRVRNKQNELRDADLRWANLSALLTETQLEYRKVFAARVQKSASVRHHPIIRASLADNKCAVCGTDHVAEVLTNAIENGNCPLCASPLTASPVDDDVVKTLRALDSQLVDLQDDLSTVLKTRERLSAELDSAEADESSARDDLARFEDKEATRLAAPQGGFSAIRKEIDRLEREQQAFRDQSEAHYRKRDELRNQLRGYEKKLKSQYEMGSEQFVPRFRELAESFIGIPIDVEIEHHQGANISGFGLKLHMNDSLRPRPEDVSESQRFFIDIALRMALAEFMADGPATLLIDTPEGSLDIAYEARAGSMFSKFAIRNRILMTANVRSSQLVLRLAKIQKASGMQIARMTDWTDLSEVQQSEEQLFSKAYEEIDAAMK